jgi:excisionase family DNA binding protein
MSAAALPAAALLFLGVGRFLDLSEVAEVLALSRSQVYALVRTGALRAVKIGGRGVWRVEGCALEDYISSAYAATTDPIGSDNGQAAADDSENPNGDGAGRTVESPSTAVPGGGRGRHASPEAAGFVGSWSDTAGAFYLRLHRLLARPGAAQPDP